MKIWRNVVGKIILCLNYLHAFTKKKPTETKTLEKCLKKGYLSVFGWKVSGKVGISGNWEPAGKDAVGKWVSVHLRPPASSAFQDCKEATPSPPQPSQDMGRLLPVKLE